MTKDEVNIESRTLPHSVTPEGDKFNFIVPDCCKLFAEVDGDHRNIDCPHVAKPFKKTKRNVGL